LYDGDEHHLRKEETMELGESGNFEKT